MLPFCIVELILVVSSDCLPSFLITIMLPPFSTGNPIGSGVFPDAAAPGIKVDRNVANIWSTGVVDPRVQAPMVSERHATWGSYQASQQQQQQQSVPEYQPSWGYQAAAQWNSGVDYGRSQQTSGAVWTNYPSSNDWANSRYVPAQSQPAAGYYYVPSGGQRQEEYIPYDIGARRAYGMPPAPPGYPLPPHMQYYGSSSHVSPASPYNVPPRASPVTGPASFLFEAAVAAKADPAYVEPREEQESRVEPRTEPRVEPRVEPRTDPREAPVRKGERVNNHQVRLHSSGNEKAPLATTTAIHASSVTTLMIRNIPNRYSQSELLTEIREAGFDTKFDFFYLPMDHETHANFGYAFINFVDEREVEPFTKRFNGLKLNRFTSNKIIQIVPAQLQGFQANLQHYCKKAVCTDDNIDYRPLFFVDGKCLEFHRASDFADAVKAKNAASGIKTEPTSPEEPPQRSGRERGNRVFQKKIGRG